MLMILVDVAAAPVTDDRHRMMTDDLERDL